MQPTAKQLKNLFALDFGTTKFCLATLKESPGPVPFVVESVSVPADGMRRGMVSNVAQAKAALRQLCELAETQFKTDVTRVVVGVAGSHLASRIVTETFTIDGDTVDGKDVQALVDRVEASHAMEGREILHTVPIGFRVDQREPVEDPVGFRGKSLSGDFFLIDADRYYLKDLVDLCNDAGLQVVRLYSEPFASASVTVPDSYKQLGVACADIGGGTTDGIVFRAGRPVAAFTVNVAGKLMTNDLAIGLSLVPEEAENVKIRFGIRPRAGDVMDVHDLRGEAKQVSGEQVLPILLPRIHELCGLLARALVPYRGTLGGGLLLTGGGADVIGITDYFQHRLNVPVVRAKPILTGALKSEAASPELAAKSPHPTKHATVIGLLNLELCRIGDLQKARKTSWTNRYLGQIFNWLKELS